MWPRSGQNDVQELYADPFLAFAYRLVIMDVWAVAVDLVDE